MTTIPAAAVDGAATSAPAEPVAWRRWAVVLAIPALVIGVAMYPDIQQELMPLSLAMALLTMVAGLIVLSGRLRLLVLLPLAAAYLPASEIGFAAYLIALVYFLIDYGGARLTHRLDGVDWALLGVLGWTLLSWLVNLGSQTDLWSLPVFILTFLTPWLLLFVARAAPWTAGELAVVIGAYCAAGAAQLAPALIKPVLTGNLDAYGVPLLPLQLTRLGLLQSLASGRAADVTTGTAESAHHLGIAMLLLVVLLASVALASKRRIVTPLLLVVLFVFMMTDSKHVILSAIPAGLIYTWLVIRPARSRAWRRRVRAGLLVLGLTVGPWVAVRVADFAVNGLWRPYVVLATINPKVQLFIRTGHLLARNDVTTWIGLGPGSFATRAATIRASDVLFKEGNRLPSFIPPFTSPAYRSVVYDLYTSAIVATARYRSGALTNPFSSLIGIVGEYGLLGTIVVAGFFYLLARAGFRRWRDATADPLWRAAGATVGFAIPLLVVLGIFDSYFEQPDVTALIMLLALVALEGPRAVSASRAES
jgi:hypothetical protein